MGCVCLNLAEATPKCEGNRALLCSPRQPNATAGVNPKDQYCSWEQNSVQLLQSQYLQSFMDVFTHLCFWRVPPEQSQLPGIPPLLPLGATVEHFLLVLDPAQALLLSCTFHGVLLHTQAQLRPDLSSAASWS